MRFVFLFVVFTLFTACQGNRDEPAGKPLKEQPKSQAIQAKKSMVSPQVKGANIGQALLTKYEKASKTLLSEIDKGPNYEAIKNTASVLVEQGVSLTKLVLLKRPACAQYLNALLKAAPRLQYLSAHDIENGYHQDGKLPKSPKEICHHAKDLVVHPATVLVMVKSAQKVEPTAMKKEIVEVIAHLHHIRALFE